VALNAPPGWLATLAARHGLKAPATGGLSALRDPGLWLAARLLARTLAEPPGGDAWLGASALQLGLLALAAGSGPAPSPGDAAIGAAVERILADHAEPLTVAALAAAAGLGERQFERRYTAATGAAPRPFLTTVRLAAARERLRLGDEPVAAIARAVGFTDPIHFGRAFKAASGLPPAAWRQHERNLNL
jgi:AraC-like DNA-binding protein